MIRDTTNVWKKTADARWGDAKSVCIEGSYGEKSSLAGGTQTASATNESGAATVVKSGALTALVVGLVGVFLVL
jgi:hypothetical protein